ncbi:MAG: phosphoglycerate kinase [Candidatus Saccharibacteria bacterium]|nr:phosphoglycerate kinase [Candidatus Saccharibacteria bacterium]
MKTIRDFNPKDKTILIRVDYNVPVKSGKVTSDLRIRASLPTINYLLEHGAKKIILISHLGRPEGKTNPDFTLSPVADTLRKLLPDVKIGFYPLPEKGAKAKIPAEVKIALLENLRFDPDEENNDQDFIKNIIDATDADTYVQDGFAVIHRAHASTDAVKNFLPVYAGLLLESEVKNLESATKNPAKPILLIIGGSKVDDKQPLIDKFATKADQIFVGGKIAADGYKAKNPRIIVADDFDEDSKGAKLDIGPLSTAKLAGLITDAKTVIWNGLLGYAEDPAYATASTITAEVIGEKPTNETTTIICGGDTTGFVEKLMEDHPSLHYSLVSTGGGASLEFLLGKKLPGLEAIQA